MKKLSAAFAALCLLMAPALNLGAQESYLPEKGEWAISVSAVPFLTYAGQFFNGTVGNAITDFASQPYLNGDVSTGAFAQLTPLASVTARYMFTDNTAFRVNLGWLYQNAITNWYSQDDAAVAANPLSMDKVIDSRHNKNNGFSLMAGVERHVGTKRIQGIFGGGVLLAAQTSSRSYTYGNAITEYNPAPTSSNGGSFNVGTTIPALASTYASMRYLNVRNANRDHYAGLVGFAGIEWFFTPKISIGGEVNVAAVYSWRSAQYFTAEGYNSASGEVDTWSQLTAPGSHGFEFGTGNIGANINLSFYF